jgi:hypothetical protein
MSDKLIDKKNGKKEAEPNSNDELKKDYAKKRMGRIVTIDVARGIGMFVILIVHAINYWVYPYMFADGGSTSAEPSLLLQIIMFPFILLGSWASVFALITGASTAYTIYYQVSQKKINMKKRVIQSFISAIILLIIHFIHVYFFIYPTYNINGLQQQGLIPGSLKGDGWVIPDPSFLFVAGPLSMIALSELSTCIVCAIIWRNGLRGKRTLKLSLLLFFSLGMFFVLIAIPVQNLLTPVLYENFEQGNYVVAMLLTWLVGSKHCLFPFVGYAFFGAFLSLHFHEKPANYRKVKIVGYSTMFFFISLAVASAIYEGGVPELVGLYHPFFLFTLNLGLQFFLATTFLLSFDTTPIEERRDKPRYTKIIGFRRFSTISLTLFLTEEIVAALYTGLFIFLFPELMKNLLFVLFVYTPILMYFWFAIVSKWEKHNFKYSFEWMLICLMKRINPNTNKDLLGVKKIIYNTSGFKDREDFYANKKILKQLKKDKKKKDKQHMN